MHKGEGVQMLVMRISLRTIDDFYLIMKGS